MPSPFCSATPLAYLATRWRSLPLAAIRALTWVRDAVMATVGVKSSPAATRGSVIGYFDLASAAEHVSGSEWSSFMLPLPAPILSSDTSARRSHDRQRTPSGWP